MRTNREWRFPTMKSEINLSLLYGKTVAALIRRFETLRHIDGPIRICVIKGCAPSPLKKKEEKEERDIQNTLASIIGAGDAPQGKELRPFPRACNHLLYLYWPRYFDQEPLRQVGILYTQLRHIDPNPRGGDKTRPGNFHYSGDVDFRKSVDDSFLEKLARQNIALKMDSSALESRYRVVGDLFPYPEILDILPY